MLSRLARLMPTAMLRRRYIRVGAMVGDALSYSYMGKCIGFDSMERALDRYENEWCRRGHFAWTRAEFEAYGGYGAPLPSHVGDVP